MQVGTRPWLHVDTDKTQTFFFLNAPFWGVCLYYIYSVNLKLVFLISTNKNKIKLKNGKARFEVDSFYLIAPIRIDIR